MRESLIGQTISCRWSLRRMTNRRFLRYRIVERLFFNANSQRQRQPAVPDTALKRAGVQLSICATNALHLPRLRRAMYGMPQI